MQMVTTPKSMASMEKAMTDPLALSPLTLFFHYSILTHSFPSEHVASIHPSSDPSFHSTVISLLSLCPYLLFFSHV